MRNRSWAKSPTLLRGGIALLVAMLSGCAGPRTFQPEKNPDSLSDEAFHGYLANVPLVSVEEAYRAVVILESGEDSQKSYDARRTYLEGKGIVRPEWGLEPGNVIDAGSVAYMVCQVCRIPGGVNYNLFGKMGLGDRRYALRELIYLNLWDDAGDYQYVTGGMLMALLSKADEYMSQHGMYEMKVDLSDETSRDASGELIVPPPLPVVEPNAPASSQPVP